MKKLNLLNQRYGKLIIIEEIGIKNGHVLWLCKCDCGNFTKLITGELRTVKGTKSCGCSKKSIREDNVHWKGHGEIPGKCFSKIKSECVRGSRTINFDLTIEQLWELFLKQNRKCALTNQNIYFNIKAKDERTASLDRIDSDKDYTIDNVQWVHKDVNNMKQDYDQKYFIETCKLIAKCN